MPSQDKFLLTASINSSNALTNLFDFVWPTAVALWNLQWQTKGYLSQVPNASVEDLGARFILGSEIRGANLHRLANEQAWPELKQWFSRILLSEVCALFEGWIESALDELSPPPNIRAPKSIDKALQFPTKKNNSNIAIGGVTWAITRVCGSAGSAVIKNCFLPTLSKNKKNSSTYLEELLVCYRAFKEVRNNFTHHGGRANAKTVQAFADYAALTHTSMGVKEKPELPNIVAGKQIELSLRGIVGLSDVVLRLVATLDCLLADSTHGEAVLKTKWKATHGGLITIKPFGPARDAQLRGLVVQCGLPPPTNLPMLYTYFHNKNLVL